MTTIGFIFPGQGSQKVGMGQDWVDASAEARATFEEADEVLGFSLSKLCWEGPAEELELTANTQPAILTCSVAIHRALADDGLEPVAMAGHSLGEYSALVASGALEFSTALKLVRRRGELMQEAVPVGDGAMAAIMGLDADDVEAVARDAAEDEICAVANLNSPQQTVIAGHRAAVERAVPLAKERGARIAKMLAVSAPFHSPLMRPAREALEPMLAAADFHDLLVPVVVNVDAVPVTLGSEAREALGRQIDNPVRWVETIRWMIDQGGVDTFLEIGFGKVLTSLGRRIDKGPAWKNLPSKAAAEAWVAELEPQPESSTSADSQ